MAAYNFRSALGGFNRQDVVNYIEYSNAKHNTLVNQLRAELAAANDQLRPLPQLQEQCAQQEAIIADLRQQVLALTEQLESVLAEQETRRNEEELEAYRRAERMERLAKERAELMYQTANGILADTTAKVDEASNQITGIADQVASQLAALQSAIVDSKQALNDAAATLYTIRPTEE